MGVDAVGFGAPAVDLSGNVGGGSDSRLKALEQKLQKLTQEKKKAVENKECQEDGIYRLFLKKQCINIFIINKLHR